jgi:hypothetical protein
MAAAEIVDREAQSPFVELREHRLHVGARVDHHRGLGDLDHQPVGIQPEGFDRREHVAHRGRLPERGRQVDRDVEVELAVAPVLRLPTGLGDDPVRERRHEPGTLGEWEEVGRGHQPSSVLPADEGFRADDLAALELHERLVMEDKAVAALDRRAQAACHGELR